MSKELDTTTDCTDCEARIRADERAIIADKVKLLHTEMPWKLNEREYVELHDVLKLLK